MGKVSVIGSLTCREGREEEMEAVLRDMVAAVRDEPGVEVYSYHRGEGNTFWFFALMSDEESMRNHGRSQAMMSAMAAFAPLAAEPPQMFTTTPIDAVGLDL